MNRSNRGQSLTRLATIAVLLLGVSAPGCVQDKTSTLSGRVVDINGKPIAGTRITIYPDQNMRRHVLKRADNIADTRHRNTWSQPSTDETDESGQFSITDIIPGPISVSVVRQTQMQEMPHFEPDKEILSLKIGKVTLFSDKPSQWPHLQARQLCELEGCSSESGRRRCLSGRN